MTEQELKDYGYRPELCRVGTLYFKNNWFVMLKDGVADFRLSAKDLESYGKAETIEELKELEKKTYIDRLNLIKIEEYVLEQIIENYGKETKEK